MEPHDLKEALTQLESLINFSFRNDLNLHSSIGGKYGELYVAYERARQGVAKFLKLTFSCLYSRN